MWVAYTPHLRATTRQRVISSSGDAPDPGAYMSPEEKPAAPSCSASSSRLDIVSSSRFVSALLVFPATLILNEPCPTSDATVATFDLLASARESEAEVHRSEE